MSLQKNVIANENSELPVFFDLYTPNSGNNWPVIVFLHGTRGFKDWGTWPAMGKWFAAKGFAFIAVNFSHNGTSVSDPTNFVNLDAFERNTISLELEDTKQIFDWIYSAGRELGLNVDDITLIGHSRGGADALVFSVIDERVTRVVALAPVADYLKSYRTFDRNDWKAKGYVSQINARTGQEMRVGYSYLQDIESNQPDYNPVHAASLLGKPLLILHGEQDESVPISESMMIYENCLHALLIRIPNAGHTFGVTHPFSNSSPLPQPFTEVLLNILEFIES